MLRLGLLLLVASVTMARVSSRVSAQAEARNLSDRDKIEQIDAIVNEYRAELLVPGCSVAVVQDGSLILAKGYGLADVEHDVPATADTVYRIASISKTFVSFATMLLVDDGKIELDDDIRKYLPYIPPSSHKVTIHHLLNHTSGIDEGTVWNDDGTWESLFSRFDELPLRSPPGADYRYITVDYMLLCEIIKTVSGMSLNDFTADRIFKPLFMNATKWDSYSEIVRHRARGYKRKEEKLLNVDWLDTDAPSAVNTIITTVLDMALWHQALEFRKLLSDESYERMYAISKLPDGRRMNYGYGWQLTKSGRGMHIYCSGGIHGFHSFIIRYPDLRLCVIVLTNLSPPGRIDWASDNPRLPTSSSGRKWRGAPDLANQIADILLSNSNAVSEDVAIAEPDSSIQLRELAVLKGHKTGVLSVAFAPDGKTLAAGAIDGKIKIWDVATMDESTTLLGKPFVVDLTFSPNGERLASAYRAGFGRLWDLRTERKPAILNNAGSSVAFSSRDDLLATTIYTTPYYAGQIELCKASTGTKIHAIDDEAASIAIAPDGASFVTGGWFPWDTKVRLWDLATRTVRLTLSDRTGAEDVVFSPDGTIIAAATDDKGITLWDVESGKQKSVLRAHKNHVCSLTFSPVDGKLLASCSGFGRGDPKYASISPGEVCLWDISTGILKAKLTDLAGAVRSIAFSPDGRKLAAGSTDNTVRLWQLIDR